MIARLAHYTRILGLPGLFGSVAGKLSGRLHTISFRPDNLPHPIYVRVPSSDVDAYDQIFLQAQYQFDVKQSPRVIIDAGANVGLAAIYFAHRFPTARIFAIECEASNFEILKRNVSPYPSIVPIQAALWDHDGEIAIVDPGLGKWGFMTATKEESTSSASCVHLEDRHRGRGARGLQRVGRVDRTGRHRHRRTP